jgi:hypothetical protein
MDRLFDTERADWLALHARVVQGEPFAHLRERAAPPVS